jgi:hypothetical protein
MPRFYFDIIDGDSIVRDENGELWPNRETGEVEAIGTAGEMVRHVFGSLHDFERAIEVRDEADETLVRVRVVVKIEIQHLGQGCSNPEY